MQISECSYLNDSIVLLNLDHTLAYKVNYYFSAAPCVKIFQLLLGEVNDCTDWRVSSVY